MEEIGKVKRGCGDLEKNQDPNKRNEKIYVSLKDQKQVNKITSKKKNFFFD